MEPAPGNLGTSSEDVTIKSRAPLTLPSHLPLLRATSDLQAASLLPLEKPERRAVPRAPKAQPGGQWERQGSSDAVGRAWCPGELRPGRPCKLQQGLGSQVSQHQAHCSHPGSLAWAPALHDPGA